MEERRDPAGAKLRDFREKHHYTIDNELIDGEWASFLGVYALAVYNVLCRCANIHTGQAFPSYAYLAKKTGMSTRQAQRATQKLFNLCIISFQQKTGRGNTNVYYLLDKSEWKNPSKKGDSQSPLKQEKVTVSHVLETKKGDSQSPFREKRVTVSPERVTVSPKKVTVSRDPLHYRNETKEQTKEQKESLDDLDRFSDLDHAPKKQKKIARTFVRKIVKKIPEHPEAKKLSDVQERTRQQNILRHAK